MFASFEGKKVVRRIQGRPRRTNERWSGSTLSLLGSVKLIHCFQSSPQHFPCPSFQKSLSFLNTLQFSHRGHERGKGLFLFSLQSFLLAFESLPLGRARPSHVAFFPEASTLPTTSGTVGYVQFFVMFRQYEQGDISIPWCLIHL